MNAEQEQAEKEFAQSILEENRDILERLTEQAGTYAEQGRSDKLYILVKAVHTIFHLAQGHMKSTLGINGGKMN